MPSWIPRRLFFFFFFNIKEVFISWNNLVTLPQPIQRVLICTPWGLNVQLPGGGDCWLWHGGSSNFSQAQPWLGRGTSGNGLWQQKHVPGLAFVWRERKMTNKLEELFHILYHLNFCLTSQSLERSLWKCLLDIKVRFSLESGERFQVMCKSFLSVYQSLNCWTCFSSSVPSSSLQVILEKLDRR